MFTSCPVINVDHLVRRCRSAEIKHFLCENWSDRQPVDYYHRVIVKNWQQKNKNCFHFGSNGPELSP